MKVWRVLLLGLLLVRGASAEEIRVSAAVSLKEAVTAIAQDFKAERGDDVVLTFGSSGQLATQVKNGAEVDVYISAGDKQVEDLIREGLADASSRRVVAGNSLVLVVPADAKDAPASIADLGQARFGKIAIGDPKTVPAGDYAMQTLKHLKIDQQLKDRLIYGANVRQVLAYVEGGEVSAGLVYGTDATLSGDKVRVAATAEETAHQPIEYPAVVIKASRKQRTALEFLEFMKGGKARKILSEQGFTVPAESAAPARATAQPAAKPPAQLWSSLRLSLAIALAATACTCLVGVPLAFAMARWRFWGKSVAEALIMVPLVLPPTVVGYLILTGLGVRSWAGAWLLRTFDYRIFFRFEGAVLASAIVALPLLYMPAKSGFEGVDRELEDVSRLLGATRLQMFWHVSLPLARRGILSGLVLAFARAIGEFGATVMVYGMQAGRLTLPISIYVDYEQDELSRATWAVMALGVLSVGLMMGYNRAVKKS